jgi:hypothetical protein
MEMVYVAVVAIAVGLVAVILRSAVIARVPRTITSLADAERLVTYHIDAANRRLRRDAWMLTFVVSHLDPHESRVQVRIGINYRRRGYPNYFGRFPQMWANARIMLQTKEKISQAFRQRGFQAEIDTFT